MAVNASQRLISEGDRGNCISTSYSVSLEGVLASLREGVPSLSRNNGSLSYLFLD